MSKLIAFVIDEPGARSIGYCVLAAGVALAVAATVLALGPVVNGLS
jgi:Flp pilus assembly pilin Flp